MNSYQKRRCLSREAINQLYLDQTSRRACGCRVWYSFVIIRPSVVIGSSVDGRYSGKRYGLYQQWMGIERLLSDRHHAELHTVATNQALNLLHQDVFQSSVASIVRWVPESEYVNLVVDNQITPSMKDIWRLFCEVLRPRTVIFTKASRRLILKQ